MEITGISWENEDGCWCLEVDEEEYKKIMGLENWQIEKQVRNSTSGNKMPWTIQMNELLMYNKVFSGKKVQLTIDIKRL